MMSDLMLTTLETERLTELENVIERGLKTFVDVGLALLEIRESKLYRTQYDTFEDYLQVRWNMSRSYAHRTIDAAVMSKNLLPMGNIQPTSERQIRPLSRLEPEQQQDAWRQAIERSNGKPTGAIVQQVVNEITKRPVSYHISDDSYEWFTPNEYISAARGVMGEIDLDPASSHEAQERIEAGEYYTKEDDGLSQPWFGRVWLNPPYNMPYVDQFTAKLVDEYEKGNIESAIVLVNNATDTNWFHRLIDYPVCFTKGRIQFWNGDERLATRQGQAIFYLGENIDLFARVFSAFGVVLIRYDNKEC